MFRTARPRVLIAGALVGALLIAGCSKEEELGGTIVKDGLGCTVSTVDRDTKEVPEVEAGAKVGKATSFKDVVKAEKKACKVNSTKYLTVDLIGATVTDGKIFNNTFEQANPLTLRLGTGQLIAGLETGLADMQVGATRQVLIPAAEAYGADGNEAQGIGPDANLEFLVRLLGVTDAPQYCNPKGDVPAAEGKPTEFTLPTEPTMDKVKVTVLTEGDGAEVTRKSYPTVHYLGIACSSGNQFDSSWDRGEPFQVALADAAPTSSVGSVIDGWTDGLAGQKVGSIVQIDIPAALGYGAAGSPPSIGPNDPLTFIVEIVDSTETTPAETTTTVAGAPQETTPESTPDTQPEG